MTDDDDAVSGPPGPFRFVALARSAPFSLFFPPFLCELNSPFLFIFFLLVLPLFAIMPRRALHSINDTALFFWAISG